MCCFNNCCCRCNRNNNRWPSDREIREFYLNSRNEDFSRCREREQDSNNNFNDNFSDNFRDNFNDNFSNNLNDNFSNNFSDNFSNNEIFIININVDDDIEV